MLRSRQGLDRVAVDSLETASIGREQGREKVTIVAQELDNRVRDSYIISTRINAAREVVAKMTALAGGVSETVGIGGHPVEAVWLYKRDETLVPWKFFFSFLAA